MLIYEIPNIIINQYSDIINHECPITPPWTMDIDINLKLSSLPKSETTPIIYKNELQSILEGYQDHICFFTDGSKTETGVGAAVTFNETIRMLKLPDYCSIYTAEALAISHALDIIKQDTINKSIILSDSLSTLTSIQNFFQPNSISQKIQNQISYLQTNSQTITFIWIPSHIGIPGNELADICAKQSISSPHSLVLCSYTLQDSKYFISEYILKNWQHTWSTLRTKLNEIKPSILPWPTIHLPRRQEVILNRIRIGHTWLTHKHLMTKTDPEPCLTCGEIPSVKHIICFCREFNDTRTKLKLADNLQEALGPDPDNTQKIFIFLKLTKLYNLI